MALSSQSHLPGGVHNFQSVRNIKLKLVSANNARNAVWKIRLRGLFTVSISGEVNANELS